MPKNQTKANHAPVDMVYEAHLARDPEFFLNEALSIVPKGGGLARLKLNNEQTEVLKVITTMMAASRPIRIIILKARQLGISTLLEGIGYWLTSTRSHTHGLVLSHDRESARWLLGMSQNFCTFDVRHQKGGMPAMSRLNPNEVTCAPP